MKDFGSYLVERGAATHAAVAAALVAQQRTRPTIGRLALEARMLDSAKVFTVLAHQARHATVRFGEAAVALGLLSREQVDQLLRAQRAKMTPIEVLLVKAGELEEATARTLREEFERETPPRSLSGSRPAVPRAKRSA